MHRYGYRLSLHQCSQLHKISLCSCQPASSVALVRISEAINDLAAEADASAVSVGHQIEVPLPAFLLVVAVAKPR